tara:strand:+ start:1103 stop:1279 length:177 start_codon:yes stop_codon:yes gene_type:complete
MKIFKNKKTLINEISTQKNIAFVPTMGSIHKGHISLIKKAKKKIQNCFGHDICKSKTI